jgi:hypothetical protein
LRLENSLGNSLTLSSTGLIQYAGATLGIQSNADFFSNGNVRFGKGMAFGEYYYHNILGNYAIPTNTSYGVILGPLSGAANTIARSVNSLKFLWYNNCWEIGATRGDDTAIQALVFAKNGSTYLAMTCHGIANFACQVCVKEAVYVYGSFPGVKLDRAGTTAQSDINWKDAGTSVWSIGTAVQAIGSNLDFYNYTLGGNVLKLTTTGEACFKYTVCSPNFQTGANSNLSKSSIRLRSANDNKYLDFNSFNTCNVINSNYGDSDIPLILGTYFGHQTNQLFLATNCNVGIGTNTPNEKLDVRGAIQVRGESLGYATTQCVGMLDFYANTTRILSFGGNATTCGCFRFYSAAQNNAGGSDVAIINGGGAACFAGTICAPIITSNANSINLSGISLLTTLETTNALYIITAQPEAGSGTSAAALISSRSNQSPSIQTIVSSSSLSFVASGQNVCLCSNLGYALTARWGIIRLA